MTVRAVTLRAGTALAVAALAALPLAGVASAAPAADRDCADFPSQAAAQAALRPGDPDGLDRNRNGIACEDSEYGPGSPAPSAAPTGTTSGTGQVPVVPSGSVDAGDGSGADGPGTGGPGTDAAGAVALGGIGAVAVAAAGWRRRASSRG